MQRARCYLLGEKAVVLELEPPVLLESQQRIWGLAERLNYHEDVREVIPGMNNITVVLESPQQVALDAIEWLQHWWEASELLEMESRDIAIPVVYGGDSGPDLPLVAEHCGMSVKQVVACHSAGRYIVYFLGFQPGFAYLGGLDEQLYTPRRAEPRLYVPAGSVGIGGHQTGIYPLSTPGGWQLIGHTPLSLFNPTDNPPTLLRPGDRVRFVPQPEGIC
ncbi:5-oxoprolinase subunit PxpB [Pectobacteriaceae bacterium CE70]|nr:5-oxoprolinase subunit PxpB [Pectobacteriaceae bacterium C52]WJV68210.1 5-oxoprolinase subunit PxpB [Pectobacteriaceae bacterium CE70]WJY12145.1 5-oxoprolinase subunit PxpB [Pectobacteriaceae bacterium C80]